MYSIGRAEEAPASTLVLEEVMLMTITPSAPLSLTALITLALSFMSEISGKSSYEATVGTRVIRSFTAISARRRSVSSRAIVMMQTFENFREPTAGAVHVFWTEVSAQPAKISEAKA